MKVALCIPVYDQPKAQLLASALGLMSHMAAERPDITIRPHVKHGCKRIEDAREGLAEWALSVEAGWLLWLDDDQSFPPDTLIRLLAHNLPWIGANIRKKDPDRVISASSKRLSTQIVPTKPKAEGVEQVFLLGFGVTLMAAEIFRKVPRPWFQWGAFGEDRYFCDRAREHGYHPHVDHSLSMEVGHIAETVLRF